MTSSLRWFVNDGGPLVVLPREALTSWRGDASASRGRATDYERACEVDDWIAPVETASGPVLVLGGDRTNAAWVPLAEEGAHLLARVIYADDDSLEKISALYEAAREGDWVRHGFTLDCAGGELLLLHAATDGAEVEEETAADDEPAYIGDVVALPAGPGRYAAETCEVVLPDEGHYILHRFRRA